MPSGRCRRVVIACLADRDARNFIWRAWSSTFDLRIADTLAGAEDELRKAEGYVLAVVVTPTVATGISAAPFVKRVVEAWPRTSVLAVCRAGFAYSGDIRVLARAGVHGLIFRGVDEAPEDLRTMLPLVNQERATDAVIRRLHAFIPKELRDLVEYAVRHSGSMRNLTEVAGILGTKRETLFRRCRRAGYPPPGTLVAWCKLFLAAYLLEESERTIEAVALEMDLPSRGCLCNLMRYHLDLTAGEVRKGGGLDFVVSIFLIRLATLATEHRPTTAATRKRKVALKAR